MSKKSVCHKVSTHDKAVSVSPRGSQICKWRFGILLHRRNHTVGAVHSRSSSLRGKRADVAIMRLMVMKNIPPMMATPPCWRHILNRLERPVGISELDGYASNNLNVGKAIYAGHVLSKLLEWERWPGPPGLESGAWCWSLHPHKNKIKI
jgi:hypothetical protein